jgi:hypothetical protein
VSRVPLTCVDTSMQLMSKADEHSHCQNTGCRRFVRSFVERPRLTDLLLATRLPRDASEDFPFRLAAIATPHSGGKVVGADRGYGWAAPTRCVFGGRAILCIVAMADGATRGR